MRVTIFLILVLLTTKVFCQKVRLEGDNSNFLCKTDSLLALYLNSLDSSHVDSLISILYDYDNGRLPNSMVFLIWKSKGISYLRIVQGCDVVLKDSVIKYEMTELWKYIAETTFSDMNVPIQSGYFISHDMCYDIAVTIAKRKFMIVVRDYERENDEKNKIAMKDNRVILANKIDDIISKELINFRIVR